MNLAIISFFDNPILPFLSAHHFRNQKFILKPGHFRQRPKCLPNFVCPKMIIHKRSHQSCFQYKLGLLGRYVCRWENHKKVIKLFLINKACPICCKDFTALCLTFGKPLLTGTNSPLSKTDIAFGDLTNQFQLK